VRFLFSNLQKLYWPKDNLTKGDYLNYLNSMANHIIPYLKNRPLVLTRYPDGIEGKSFYQKDLPNYAPSWLDTFLWYSEHSQRYIAFPVVNRTESLLWLGNLGAIEMHPWLSRVDSVEYPDVFVIDLDPSKGATFSDVVEVAKLTGEVLSWAGLQGYPKTSGASGLHIYVPIINEYTYAEVVMVTREIGRIVAGSYPKKVTLERRVKDRGGKVYFDYLQNHLGKTLAGVYLPRPLNGAPVSMPVSWDELTGIRPLDFTIRTVREQITERGDLFKGVLENKQNLKEVFDRFKLTV